MFDTQYIWASNLGFWMGLGVIQAIVLSLTVFYFVGKIVDKAYGFFGDDSVSKYAFSVLPDHYESMSLTYVKKTKTITATASYMYNNEAHTRSYSCVIKDASSMESHAENIQLVLMSIIAKEIEEWNKTYS